MGFYKNYMGFYKILPDAPPAPPSKARRSFATLNMVQQGLMLLPFMLYEECRPGPTWEFGNQWKEGMAMVSMYLGPSDMQEWVLSCLSCGHYEGHCPFIGWSPFRSVATNTGYYKVGDRGCWDIQLFKPLEDVDLWTWWDMTQKFARVAGYIALKFLRHPTTLWELFQRELREMPPPMDEIIAAWHGCTPQQLLEILAGHSTEAYYAARRMMLPEKNLLAKSGITSFAIAVARTSRAQRILISRCMPKFGLVPSNMILKMLGFGSPGF